MFGRRFALLATVVTLAIFTAAAPLPGTDLSTEHVARSVESFTDFDDGLDGDEEDHEDHEHVHVIEARVATKPKKAAVVAAKKTKVAAGPIAAKKVTKVTAPKKAAAVVPKKTTATAKKTAAAPKKAAAGTCPLPPKTGTAKKAARAVADYLRHLAIRSNLVARTAPKDATKPLILFHATDATSAASIQAGGVQLIDGKKSDYSNKGAFYMADNKATAVNFAAAFQKLSKDKIKVVKLQWTPTADTVTLNLGNSERAAPFVALKREVAGLRPFPKDDPPAAVLANDMIFGPTSFETFPQYAIVRPEGLAFLSVLGVECAT